MTKDEIIEMLYTLADTVAKGDVVKALIQINNYLVDVREKYNHE